MLRFEAVLICSGCNVERMNMLTEQELDRLKSGDCLDLMCSECHSVTAWNLPVADRRQPAERRREEERRTGKERRAHGRVQLYLPIEYRYSVGGLEFSEATSTANICRDGIYFLTAKELRWGMKLTVVLPHSLVPDPKNPALQGRIVRIDRRSDDPPFGVAVHFEGITLDL